MSLMVALFRREVDLAWRSGGPFLAVGFFVSVTTLFPLALGADNQALAAGSGGITWVALILASLLSLDRLFERDLENGALDLLATGRLPLEVVGFIKCLAQWAICGVPLALMAPLGALSLGLPAAAAPMLVLTSLIGGLAFALVGGTGAALALVSGKAGILVSLIVLPLLTPPVIFGGAAIDRAARGGSWEAALALLCAYTFVVVALAPFAIGGACRNALS